MKYETPSESNLKTAWVEKPICSYHLERFTEITEVVFMIGT